MARDQPPDYYAWTYSPADGLTLWATEGADGPPHHKDIADGPIKGWAEVSQGETDKGKGEVAHITYEGDEALAHDVLEKVKTELHQLHPEAEVTYDATGFRRIAEGVLPWSSDLWRAVNMALSTLSHERSKDYGKTPEQLQQEYGDAYDMIPSLYQPPPWHTPEQPMGDESWPPPQEPLGPRPNEGGPLVQNSWDLQHALRGIPPMQVPVNIRNAVYQACKLMDAGDFANAAQGLMAAGLPEQDVDTVVKAWSDQSHGKFDMETKTFNNPEPPNWRISSEYMGENIRPGSPEYEAVVAVVWPLYVQGVGLRAIWSVITQAGYDLSLNEVWEIVTSLKQGGGQQSFDVQATYYEPQYPWIGDTDGYVYLGGPGENHEQLADRHQIPKWRRQHHGVIFKGEVVHSTPMPPQAVLEAVEAQWGKLHAKDFETRKQRGQFAAAVRQWREGDRVTVNPGASLNAKFTGDGYVRAVLQNGNVLAIQFDHADPDDLFYVDLTKGWDRAIELLEPGPMAGPFDYNPFEPDTPEQIDTMVRSGAWMTSDYQGFTNWDTWNTALMADNDYDLYQQKNKLMAQGATVEQIRDWLIEAVVGPHNQQAIADSQEWNDIPQHERLDHNWEDLKQRNPQAADIVDSLGMGEDVSDDEPMLINESLVNWDEIYNHWREEIAEEERYQQGQPPPPAPDLDQPGNFTLPEGWTARVAAMSRTRLLDMARKLPHDQSQIVHEFGNGWTVRQLTNNGDRHREGHLMSNCWRFEPGDIPVDRLHDFMAQPITQTIGHPYEMKVIQPQWMSLRDPDNIPHTSFYQTPDSDGSVYEMLGTHNSSPKDQYVDMLRQYAYENGHDFPGWVATAATEGLPYAMKLHIGYYLGFLNGYANTHIDFAMLDRLRELEAHFSQVLWGDAAYKMGWDRAKAQGFYPDPNQHPAEQTQNEAPFASTTPQEVNEILAWLESHVAADQMEGWQAETYPDEPGKLTFPEDWTSRVAAENEQGQPLGFCDRCFRVRYLAKVEREDKGMPYGVCTQCDREEHEGTTAKTAAGQVMYHSSPRQNRESILTNGLIPGTDEDFSPLPFGIYLTAQPQTDVDEDQYAVDVSGLDVQLDPYENGGNPDAYLKEFGGSYYVADPIPPDRLSLLTHDRSSYVKLAARVPFIGEADVGGGFDSGYVDIELREGTVYIEIITPLATGVHSETFIAPLAALQEGAGMGQFVGGDDDGPAQFSLAQQGEDVILDVVDAAYTMRADLFWAAIQGRTAHTATKVGGYVDRLNKWVYIPGKGHKVWSDIEFNRQLQERFLREHWAEPTADDPDPAPPEYPYFSHSDALNEIDPNSEHRWTYATGMHDPATGEFSIDHVGEGEVDPEDINQQLFGGSGQFAGYAPEEVDLRDRFGHVDPQYLAKVASPWELPEHPPQVSEWSSFDDEDNDQCPFCGEKMEAHDYCKKCHKPVRTSAVLPDGRIVVWRGFLLSKQDAQSPHDAAFIKKLIEAADSPWVESRDAATKAASQEDRTGLIVKGAVEPSDMGEEQFHISKGASVDILSVEMRFNGQNTSYATPRRVTADSFGGGGNMPSETAIQDGWTTADPSAHTTPKMREAPMPALDHPRQMGFDTSKTYWAYLNGEVAFGPTLHGAMLKVCVDRLDDTTTKRLCNLMAAGAYPQGVDYNIAAGVLTNTRPRIFATNVDRNAVYDAVFQKANMRRQAHAQLCSWCDLPATWEATYSFEHAGAYNGNTPFHEFACDEHKQRYFDELALSAAEPGTQYRDVVIQPYSNHPGQLFQTSRR